MAPSTFASAAAGNTANSAPTRDASSDWSRRPNGATQTFRRTSAASSMSTANQPDGPPSQAPRYVPPHRNGTQADTRYSREQLLDLYKSQHSVEGGVKENLSNLFVGGWQPESANGGASVGWGRTESSKDGQPGPDICWDKEGSVEPLALLEMDDEERELFSTSVNTPLKPPATKESQQANGLPGRRVSMSSQATAPGGQGPLSPTSTRAPGRRRETSESLSFQSNPLSSPPAGSNRDEQRAPSPPPSLQRRRTDLKDANKLSDGDGEADDKSSSSPFGSLKRVTTGPLSAGLGNPMSPWSNTPQSAGLSPMGSFGNFGLGQSSGQSEKRPALSGGRSESRFKNVLNKDSSEDITTKSVERKTSMSSLSRVNENELWKPQHGQNFGNAPPDETEEDLPTGSAALTADADANPMALRQGGSRALGTPSHGESYDEYGFGAFGMSSDTAYGFGHAQQPPAYQRQMGTNEPMSPTGTNPYKSPDQRGIEHLPEDLEPDLNEIQNAQLPGLGPFGNEQAQHFGAFGSLSALPNLGRAGTQAPAGDRSQTSSAGANRGFPSLGGLPLGAVSGAAAWPVSQGGIGTPSRQTAGLSTALGSGIFTTTMGDLQSPGLAGLGSGSIHNSQGGLGGSRMTSMFPPAMQDQMRYGEQDLSGERGAPQPFPGLGGFGRPGDASAGSGDFPGAPTELERSLDQQGGQLGAGAQQLQAPSGQPVEQSLERIRSQQPSAQSQTQPQQTGNAAANQPAPPQQRTMVMPDRMRWIYRDPQGQTQGPWSGLEMHDWYKAGFFSPELLVKKLEDPDYEPLAQLIRRIGNSREPFLVPQIGIPHGVPSSTGPSPWPGSASGSAGTGGAQPPFASSFPSFGTTLTAEQQNALERRKQEEQYLMARQKEHLAQAQMAQRIQHPQMGPGGAHAGLMPAPGQLHHHASAQSLHSQPSLGSMTSPSAGPFQPSPNQGPQSQAPGFYDNSFRATGQHGGSGAVGSGADNLGQIREEEIPGIMHRLSFGNRAAQGQFGAPGQPFAGLQLHSPPGSEQQERQVQQMLQDRARLQQEQEQYDAALQASGDDQMAMASERLQQFQQLQGQAPPTAIDARFQPAIGKSTGVLSDNQSILGSSAAAVQGQAQFEEPSLTKQVQKAASAQQAPAPKETALPQPFPPAPSQSPLPAPAAQRTGRQSVADQLQTEQRDLSETSSVDTPSAVAPWAKESAEANRGPSLKEIQAMEAKKAAEAEELASVTRRAAFQKEAEAQAQAQAQPAPPGLPVSASWAASGSIPTAGNAAWAKTAQKPTGPATAKNMAQIQKEEEARKKKVAAAAANVQAVAMGGTAAPAGGKSYANLAGKIAMASPTNAAGGVWTTVGAGGKAKSPANTTPAPAPPRAVSSSGVPAVQSITTAAKKPPTRSATMVNPATVNAQDEFRRWAVGELRPDLNKGISADDFVSSLVYLPPDSDIITEAVHGASSTIDSRHFAEEFIRRKKLADKGLVDSSAPPKSTSPHTAGVDKSGGWSEVAKKGPSKETSKDESNGNFRVVAAKKKGGKR